MAPRNKTPGEGHNVPDLLKDQDKFTFYDQNIRALENKAEEKRSEAKAATKALNNGRLGLKSALNLGLEEYDYARRLSELNPDEARKLLTDLVKVCAMLGVTIPDDALISITKDPYEKMPEIERDRAVWRERGRVAALSGKGAFAGEAPDGCPPDAYQAWADGVNAGHEELARRMQAGEKAAGPLFANSENDGDEGEAEEEGDE